MAKQKVVTAPEPAREGEDEMHVLFPGKVVPIGDTGLTATVYPLGFIHLRKFTSSIAGVIFQLLAIKVPKDADQKAKTSIYIAQMVPFILQNALELFTECVKIKGGKLDDLPHWEVPPLIELWVIESFGEERKWRPWVTSVEKIVTQMTGKPFRLSESLSSFSSSADTDVKT